MVHMLVRMAMSCLVIMIAYCIGTTIMAVTATAIILEEQQEKEEKQRLLSYSAKKNRRILT